MTAEVSPSSGPRQSTRRATQIGVATALIAWPTLALGAGSLGGDFAYTLIFIAGLCTWPFLIFTDQLMIRFVEAPLRARWRPSWPRLESVAAGLGTVLIMGPPIAIVVLAPLGQVTGFMTLVDCTKVQCDTGGGVI
jgi:hypothetical protein